MAEKIDFGEAEKDDIINIQKLLNVLSEISRDEENVADLIYGLKNLIEHISIFREIICCIFDREKAQDLILSLDEDKLVSFECFLNGLKVGRESSNYTKAYNALLEVRPSTPKSILKAKFLIEKIAQRKHPDLQELSLDLYSLSSHLKILAGIFHNYQNNHRDNEWPIRLAQLSLKDFERIIPLCESILDFGAISVDDYGGFNEEMNALENETDDGIDIDVILDCLLTANMEMGKLQKNGDLEKLNEKSTLYAPIAFEAYKRIYGKKEVPYFIQDLMRGSSYSPFEVSFWNNCYAFAMLIDKLIDDGYYYPKKETENASA